MLHDLFMSDKQGIDDHYDLWGVELRPRESTRACGSTLGRAV
jgi:hypothetical protein